MNIGKRQEEKESNFLNHMEKKEKLSWLMDEYGHSVTRLAFTYLHDNQAAEDIAQEVFIKCFEKLEDFRGEASYKTWLYKITINKCKDFLRSWAYRNVRVTSFIGTFNKSTEKSAEVQLLLMEENTVISEMVMSLPVKYREMIIFYYYENLSIAAISELLEMNTNTVKSRLQRGRLLLKKKMEGGDFHGK